jgi:uncharacterized protein GlcG (DUF336 family)
MSIQQKTLQLADARRVIDAATKKAEEINQPMCFAVVCAGGHLLAFERMQNAWIGSIDIAMQKAWTARAFDSETSALGKIAQPGAEFYGIEGTNGGRVVLLAGGVPLLQDGAVVGALGVSGGSAAQDVEVAKAGCTAF